MALPLSNDMRKRIINTYNEGQSVKTIVSSFRVSPTAVYNLIQLYKETNSYEPRAHKAGRKPALTAKQLEEIKALILQSPDIELQAIKDELELPVSVPALCKTINKKLKLKRKKNFACQ